MKRYFDYYYNVNILYIKLNILKKIYMFYIKNIFLNVLLIQHKI